MKIITHYTSALASLLALGLVSTPLRAQESLPAPGAIEEQPIVLERFTVNVDTDRGYVAVDSLAGGRTNTPIRLTPSAMSSVTRTFIDDLAIQDVREALKWAPNVVPTDQNAGKGFGGSAFHEWSFNFRGAGAGQQGGPGPTRNYFSFYQNADSYNIERIEFTRGPNSILFGLGTVGGTLTTYTKVPRLDKNFYTVTAIVDSNDSLRFEGDFNQAVGEKLAIRVNALKDMNRGWRNNDKNEKEALDVALLYKFNPNTSLRVEVEGARIDKTLISSNVLDKLSGWDGTTSSATWREEPTGPARTVSAQSLAWSTNPFWVYIPTSQSLSDWNGGFASSSSLLDVGQGLNFQPYRGWYPEEIKLPWETEYSSTTNVPVRPSKEWTYGDGRSESEYGNITAFLDHKFNENFDLQLGFYRYRDFQTARDYEGVGAAAIDINRQLPDGSANPNYGKSYGDFFLSKQTQGRAVTEYRAQLNYNFESELFGKRWSQLFSVSAAQKKLDISARQYLGQVNIPIDNPGDWPQRLIFGRIYMDDPNVTMDIPTSINGLPVAYMPSSSYWFDFDDTFELTDYAFLSHSRLLDDQLSILLGARHDSYDEHLISYRRGPNGSDVTTDESDDGNTYSAGAVYYFDWLGVFVNYSKNIQPPNAGSQPLLNGERPGPENGKGIEYGIRISTGDGKYYATLSRYDTESEGRLVENPIDLRGIWQKYNLALGNSPESGNGGLAYSDTTSLDVSGYEFEITANPTPNLRLQATYGKPDSRIVDYYPDTRAYFAANSAEWNSVINNASLDPTLRNDLQTKVTEVDTKLAQSLPGARQEKLVDYTASFFANYTFTQDRLDGFSIGAGVSQTGAAYAATYEGEEYFGSKIENTYAVLAYETRWGRARVRLALNVDNILDDADPIITSYHWGYMGRDGTHIPDGYYFQNPRTYRLTARFTF